MKYVPRRESSATRKSKSSRATEQGIAGHQAAMKALGKGTKEPGDAPRKFIQAPAPQYAPSPDDEEAFERYFSEQPQR